MQSFLFPDGSCESNVVSLEPVWPFFSMEQESVLTNALCELDFGNSVNFLKEEKKTIWLTRF